MVLVELHVGLGFLAGPLLQEPEYPVGEHSAQFADEGTVLEQFAAEVERNILGVYHSLHKSVPKTQV